MGVRMNRAELGYSKLAKREVVVDYYYKKKLTCDGDRVPELMWKVAWKVCWNSNPVFECLGDTKETTLANVLDSVLRNYQIKSMVDGEKSDGEILESFY